MGGKGRELERERGGKGREGKGRARGAFRQIKIYDHTPGHLSAHFVLVNVSFLYDV